MSDWTSRRLTSEHEANEVSWPTLLRRVRQSDLEDLDAGRDLDHAIGSMLHGVDGESSPPYSTDMGAAADLFIELQNDSGFEVPYHDMRCGVGLIWSDTLARWECGPLGYESIHAIGVSEDRNNPALAVCRAWLIRQKEHADNDG